MAPPTNKGFHLFGTEKVLVKYLAVYGVKWTKWDDEKDSGLVIGRTRKQAGSIQTEPSNIIASYYAEKETLFLRDIFLTRWFGITLQFAPSAGRFDLPLLAEVANPKKDSPLIFLDFEGEKVMPQYHFELGPAK